MNPSLLAAALLFAAPAGAAAASHSVSVRFQQGNRSFSKTVKATAGSQVNFVGPVGGKNVIVNVVLSQEGKALRLEYQLEASDAERTFQAQAGLELLPGERVRAVECGEWTVDVALDAAAGPSPAWKSGGPNYRLTSQNGRRRCRVVQTNETQSNIVESGTTNGRRLYSISNSVISHKAGNSFNLRYQQEEAGKQDKGEATLLLGKKTRASSIEFLLEGAPVREAAAEDAPRPREEPTKQGAVRMLR